MKSMLLVVFITENNMQKLSIKELLNPESIIDYPNFYKFMQFHET